MDDDSFLRRFEDRTLPFDQWTHRAHVKVAYLYLERHGLREAIDRMRAGVKAYNAANDVPEGALTGYNETTTVAFMHIIHGVKEAYAATHPVKSADEFCDTHPQLMSKHVLRFFYTPAQRIRPEAKTTFVEPDLTAFPGVTARREDREPEASAG